MLTSNPIKSRCNAVASHTFHPIVPIWVVWWFLIPILIEASVMKSSSACASQFSPVQILYQVCPDKLDKFLHLHPIGIYFAFPNPECFYTVCISLLFCSFHWYCTLPLNNHNDSHADIGIVHLYQHILYLHQSILLEGKECTCHHLHSICHHQHWWLYNWFVALWGWRCWVRRRYSCLAGIKKLGEQVAKNTKLK